jgi:hypothetical protein
MSVNRIKLGVKRKSLATIIIFIFLVNFIPLIAMEMSDEGNIDVEIGNDSLDAVSGDEDALETYESSRSSRATDTFELQPDWKSGTDTFIANEGGAWVNRNFGNETYFGVGGDPRNYRALVYFDLSPLPLPSVPIKKATLKLFFASKSGVDENPVPVSIYRMKEHWTEGTGTTTLDTSDGATWNNYNGANSWTLAGGYFDTTSENETEVSVSNKWYNFEITDLVSKWHKSEVENYGLMVKYPQESTYVNSFKTFYSSDTDIADRRPKLSVEYENSPPIVTATAPDQLLMSEDQGPESLPMASVFNDADGFNSLSFSLWTGTEWGLEFETSVYTATLSNKGSVASPNYVLDVVLIPNKSGTVMLTLNATDKIRHKIHDIDVIVAAVNDDPILAAIGDRTVTEEIVYEFDITATDVETNALSFSANVSEYDNPDYLGEDFLVEKDKNDPNLAKVTYYPSNNDVPYIYVNFTVEDGLGGVDYEHVKFTVNNINDAPKILKVAGEQPSGKKIVLTAIQGSTRNFRIEAEDDDSIHGDKITITSDRENNENFTLYEDTGVVLFKPTNDDVPKVNIKFTVTDLNLSTDYVDVTFDVTDVNDPPVITKLVSPIHNAEFTTTELIHFEADYDDPDLHIEGSGEVLNITWFSDIEGAIGYGGELDTYLSAGSHNITFKVKDADPVTEATKITFTVKVTKAITLTEDDCDRLHFDDEGDVVSYFHNIDNDQMEYERGGEPNLDIVEMSSSRVGNNLEIILKVDGLIESSKSYAVFLVKPGHIETTDFYNPTSTNIYDTLYKPNSTIMYGEIPSSYRKIDVDTITYTINLGDLEAGDIEGWTEGLKSDFDLFAVTKWNDMLRYDTGLYSVVSYDSAGLGAAFPGEAPVITEEDDDKAGEIDEMVLWIIIVIIIVVVVIVVLLFIRQKKGAKADIDYTGGDYKSTQAPAPEQQPTQDIPSLFQSPFEQQFGGAGQQPQQPGQYPTQLEVGVTQQSMYMQQPSAQAPGTGGVGVPPQPMQQQPQATKSCPNCKKNIMANSRMCPYCGNPV